MPPFEFDVTSTDVQRFRQFIDEMREALRVPDRPFVMQQAVRLPPQVDDPALVDLVLRANDRQVPLILRTDNLYVIGFRNHTGRAYEFLHDNGRRPRNGSQPLPFNGSYTGGIAPLDQTDAILGQHAVHSAINVLSTNNGRDSPDARRALRVLIVNFIESIRFNDIADRVGTPMRNPNGSTQEDRCLTPANINLINNWGNLSSALTIAVNNSEEPGPSAQFFQDFATFGIHNAYTAAVALGMVLSSTTTGHCRRRLPRSVGDAPGDDGIGGLTLVEVIGVLITDIDGENPGDLYGTVSITDCFGTVMLFDRRKNHTQSVGPGGWADITWPPRAVSGADDFTIGVDLMDHDSFPDITPDDRVALGQLFWNSRDTLGSEFNTVQRKQVRGTYGSVDVHYAVLTDSVVAAVRVIMVDGDGENVPDVYGTITAETRTASGQQLEYNLFSKERGQSVGVPRNAAIPLQRSVMSAALCSELRVRADLWDADRFPDLSYDDHIAQDSATFQPLVEGCSSAGITGQHGMVRVEVTWSLSHQAPPYI